MDWWQMVFAIAPPLVCGENDKSALTGG